MSDATCSAIRNTTSMFSPFTVALRSLVMISLVMMTGCMHYQPWPLSASASAESFTGRSLNDAGLKTFLSEQGVRSSPKSWTPDRLALAAAYFHSDVAVARAEAQEAEAAITTAAQRPNPVLSFSPEYNSTSSGISPWIITPTLDVPIETAGKRSHRIEQSRATAEAARLRVAAKSWDVRSKVHAAMLDLHAARESEALLKEEQALHEEELKRLDAQVKAGETPAFELTQARLSLNRARLALHDVEMKSATARAALAAAVGVPASAIDAVSLDFSVFNSLPAAPGSRTRKRALTHRADLLAALADYAATEGALRLEIAKQYPDIHINPGYQLDQTDNQWALGISVELPILNQNRGPIAQAEAKRKTAQAKFEGIQATVFGEIELALAAYRAAQAKAATAGKLTDDAAAQAESARKMVEAGELSPLEHTRRRIEVSAARLAKQEALQEARVALAALEAAIQVPARKW